MADRTERTFAPDSREPSRRRFMIAGEHVILRALLRDDAERCYRWMNDPNIVRTLKSRYPIAFQNEAEWLESAMHPPADQRHFAVERKDDRTHIGNASIHEIEWVSRTAALYVFIGEPSAWNRGFGSDAIAALVGFAFERLDLERIELWSLGTNERAIRAYRACGFELDATLPRRSFRGGEWVDRVVMSVTREAFARIGSRA